MAVLANISSAKLIFSGHETFHCRHLWLKKGYDFVHGENKFSDEDAVITLGVGKNMVSAISFWMKAFGLLDREGNLGAFAHYIFSDEDGRDPYLEDEATLWLLHYHLVTQNLASTYNYIFNDLRKERIEFTKDSFLSFMERKANEVGFNQFNIKTTGTDFDVLTKMYISTLEQSKEREDTLSGLLTGLNLIQEEKRKVNDKTTSLYSIPNENRNELPEAIILYALLDQDNFQQSINFNTLHQDRNQAGNVFAITKTALMHKLEAIVNSNVYRPYGITLSDHAGIKELQFTTKPDKFQVLNHYYGH